MEPGGGGGVGRATQKRHGDGLSPKQDRDRLNRGEKRSSENAKEVLTRSRVRS